MDTGLSYFKRGCDTNEMNKPMNQDLVSPDFNSLFIHSLNPNEKCLRFPRQSAK